jgi:branched-chain amino acid transport system permease protein
MPKTANYRQGIERFIPSPSEAVLLAAMVIFCWKMYGGTSNDAIAGLNSVVVVTIAWVLGVAVRAAMNDMRWWLVIGVLVLLIVPWLGANTFQISLMAQVCAYTLLLLGLNIVTGLTGQISLGHGALVGISAYTVAILVHQYDWGILPAAGVAMAITTCAGFALGIPALRLTGPYLAIATLAAALIFPGVLKLDQVNDTTGGVQGIAEAKISPPGALNTFLIDHAPSDVYKNAFQQKKFAQEAYVFYLTAATALIGLFCAWNLARSRFGRAFISVRDGEVAATSMGVNVALYKVTAFGISALYAGVCGVLFFLVISFVAPESFDLVNMSINPLAFMVIGGLATTGGPVIGAIGFMWVPQIIKKIATISADFDKLQGAMTGLLLIVVMTRLPQGVWGTLVRLNRLSWSALLQQSRSSVLSRSPLFWVGVTLGVAGVLVIGQAMGAVWAVFAAGLFVVAPQDVWFGLYAFIRRPVLALRGGGNESPQPDAT